MESVSSKTMSAVVPSMEPAAATESKSSGTSRCSGVKYGVEEPPGVQNFSSCPGRTPPAISSSRSEEHTSELQSRQYLVCRLLLDKKDVVERPRLDDVATSVRQGAYDLFRPRLLLSPLDVSLLAYLDHPALAHAHVSPPATANSP